DSAEIGFWVHPDHRGKGLAPSALALAAAFARRSGLSRLTARTVPENRAAQRALEKSGFLQGEPTGDVAPSGQEVVLRHYLLDLGPASLFPVQTERLRLRLHEHADGPALRDIYRRPEVSRYLLDEPWSGADAERQLSERV